MKRIQYMADPSNCTSAIPIAVEHVDDHGQVYYRELLLDPSKVHMSQGGREPKGLFFSTGTVVAVAISAGILGLLIGNLVLPVVY